MKANAGSVFGSSLDTFQSYPSRAQRIIRVPGVKKSTGFTVKPGRLHLLAVTLDTPQSRRRFITCLAHTHTETLYESVVLKIQIHRKSRKIYPGVERAVDDFYRLALWQKFRANFVNLRKNLPRHLKLLADCFKYFTALDPITAAKTVLRVNGFTKQPFIGKLRESVFHKHSLLLGHRH